MSTRRSRSEIVQAALAVFREKGYERATVRDIAAKAGLGSSSLYSHIKSKRDLFLEAVGPVIEAGAERMTAVVNSDLEDPEKLRAAIVGTTEAFAEHYPEAFVYLRDFYPVLETADPELRRRYESAWTEIIESGIRKGVFRSDADPKVVAYGILGMCNWLHRWYRLEGRCSATEIGGQFANVILDGLRPRE